MLEPFCYSFHCYFTGNPVLYNSGLNIKEEKNNMALNLAHVYSSALIADLSQDRTHLDFLVSFIYYPRLLCTVMVYMVAFLTACKMCCFVVLYVYFF